MATRLATKGEVCCSAIIGIIFIITLLVASLTATWDARGITNEFFSMYFCNSLAIGRYSRNIDMISSSDTCLGTSRSNAESATSFTPKSTSERRGFKRAARYTWPLSNFRKALHLSMAWGFAFLSTIVTEPFITANKANCVKASMFGFSLSIFFK